MILPFPLPLLLWVQALGNGISKVLKLKLKNLVWLGQILCEKVEPREKNSGSWSSDTKCGGLKIKKEKLLCLDFSL